LRAKTPHAVIVEGKCPETGINVRITARLGWRDGATLRSVSRSVRYDCRWDGGPVAAAASVFRFDANGAFGHRARFEGGERFGLRQLHASLAKGACADEKEGIIATMQKTAALLDTPQ
jgi:hypothetical protein